LLLECPFFEEMHNTCGHKRPEDPSHEPQRERVSPLKPLLLLSLDPTFIFPLTNPTTNRRLERIDCVTAVILRAPLSDINVWNSSSSVVIERRDLSLFPYLERGVRGRLLSSKQRGREIERWI